jgi:hypothetical protein
VCGAHSIDPLALCGAVAVGGARSIGGSFVVALDAPIVRPPIGVGFIYESGRRSKNAQEVSKRSATPGRGELARFVEIRRVKGSAITRAGAHSSCSSGESVRCFA